MNDEIDRKREERREREREREGFEVLAPSAWTVRAARGEDGFANEQKGPETQGEWTQKCQRA